MILRIKGSERSIASANSVANANLIRVVNTGAAATLNIAYANAIVYANVTVTNTEPVIIEKSPTDLVTGANMVAAPIAYRN